MAVELRRVPEQVTDLGLGWQPGDTVHTDLSLMRIRSRTGAVPPAGHRSMGERQSAAAAAHRQDSAATAPKLPSKIDWNTIGGWFTNWEDWVRAAAKASSTIPSDMASQR